MLTCLQTVANYIASNLSLALIRTSHSKVIQWFSNGFKPVIVNSIHIMTSSSLDDFMHRSRKKDKFLNRGRNHLTSSSHRKEHKPAKAPVRTTEIKSGTMLPSSSSLCWVLPSNILKISMIFTALFLPAAMLSCC